MKPSQVKIGMLVRVRETIPASYSGYGGLPKQDLTPDIVARVVSANIPKVCIIHRHSWQDSRGSFVRVEFKGVYHAGNGSIWSAGVNYCNLREVRV